MNKLLNFLKNRKNRDIVLYICSGLALLLPIAAYLLDEQQGDGIRWLLYALSPICLISIVVAIVMLAANCWISIGRRIREKKEK